MERSKTMMWTLFKSCFIISACTFGGGMVIIAMLQKKFVEELQWISEDEAMDMVAIAQSSPGVMAVNTSLMIGYRMAGLPGALLTVFGTVLPPMLILTLVSVFYARLRTIRLIALLLRGMQAGVAAVVIHSAIRMSKNALKDRRMFSLVMLILAGAAVIVLKVDVIVVILLCGAAGLADAMVQAKRREQEGQA